MFKNNAGLVRITGGEFRGRKILTPGGETHPMGERERIALFNMISEYIPGSSAIDLYCGGGTLGIEMLSRGANFVLFVDKNEQAITTTKENLKKLSLDNSSKVIRSDVSKLDTTDKYGVVIADPPYDKYRDTVIESLPYLMAKDGVLVLSHPGDAPDFIELKLLKTRQYAAAHISIYAKK